MVRSIDLAHEIAWLGLSRYGQGEYLSTYRLRRRG
jgi:hypothetical protein